MSKSLGTAVDPLDAAERFGADPLRLYLVKEIVVRRRRRLHLGAVRGPLQRRSREQPRQPRQPHRRDGREVSRRPAAAGRAARDGSPAWRAQASRTTGATWTRLRSRAGRRGLPHRRRGQRVHRRDASRGRWRATRRTPDRLEPGAVRRRGGRAGRRDPAAARHAALGGGDPAARGRGHGRAGLDGAAWRNEGERVVVKGEPCGRVARSRQGRSEDRRSVRSAGSKAGDSDRSRDVDERRTQARSRRPPAPAAAPASAARGAAPRRPRPRRPRPRHATARSPSTIS